MGSPPRWQSFIGRFQGCLYKFLDVIVKPESYKIKVIPSVAEYRSALTKSINGSISIPGEKPYWEKPYQERSPTLFAALGEKPYTSPTFHILCLQSRVLLDGQIICQTIFYTPTKVEWSNIINPFLNFKVGKTFFYWKFEVTIKSDDPSENTDQHWLRAVLCNRM